MSSIGGVGSGTNPLQQAMRQLFSKSDANTDGKLDTSEISSLLDTLQSGSSDSSLTSDGIVSAFDTDGDGAVSGSEFDAGFKKLGEQMHSTMLAMQESGQMPSPPPGPPPGMSGDSASDDDEDDDTSTVATLLDLLQSYSSEETEDTASSSDSTTTTTDTLLQTFLGQLEQYARQQDRLSAYQSQYGSGVSVSA
ncbi:MAG: EF-hand domain-containing protein [Ferrovibrio sp.]|uniref:EF-hand domain-containing protein n=1 Tax=Ferrovibrio sp. TaxID=1917215 RepID=UPI002611F387|nr:EF-hand domain-containing protein [Ferrovibrio sp.]MCW0232517.1 EF-hand domain-containing protein [Ferrovibrio sp.]